MKSDLDELIELLEAELKTLEEYIKVSVEDSEYLNAHYHSQASFKIQSQLYILYKLRDPLYNEKQRLEQTLKIFERKDTDSNTPRLKAYYDSETKKYREKLEKLNEQKCDARYDDQQLDNALFKIVEGKCTGFILYLNASDNLGITFERSGSYIEISLSVKNILKVDIFLTDEEEHTWPVNKFKALGFDLNPGGNNFIYRFSINDFRDALEIKTLLSRLIYDLFSYCELDSPANMMFF